MNIAPLQKVCKGSVVVPGDANFKKFAYDDLWNLLRPDRTPQVIVRVKDENDAVEAVKFARDNNLKVTVRGGGHNWCSPSLRNSGMLIDLTELNKVISIDSKARKAVVQPIISNRESMQAFTPLGLAFPCGHCPTVKLSGYLLGGGLPWNQGVWGHGCESVEAIELVTAEGKRITASKDENKDYFWAACGAGSGFFGVALRYHLKLHPLPKAIHCSVYYYSLSDAAALAAWLETLAPTLPAKIELSLFVVAAPKELKEACASNGGKVAMITAVSYADTEQEAKDSLKPFEDCPIIAKALSKSVAFPTNFEGLFDASGAMWPAPMRSRVESTFSNAKPADFFTAVTPHLAKMPSPLTVFMYVFFTGPNVPGKQNPDIAYSMNTRYLAGCWTMWMDPKADDTNSTWHEELLKQMKPFLCGNYIGESDTVTYPEDAVNAYSPENWKRLAELRTKLDPTGVFFGYTGGFGK
ncbi:MAG: FAD-binding oxidoreductase [Chthoniobacterales bacterium]